MSRIGSAPARSARSVVITLLVALVSVGLLAVAPAARAEPTPVGAWPLQPSHEVVAGFDPPDGPYGAGHRGVDLLGRVGQTVFSALPGRVTYAGRLAGRGVVVVDHGDTRTTYEPVTASVAVGQVVARGQAIGHLELSGSHCFPRACLHWGWIRGVTYLDPLLLVGAGPVRLLPLVGLPPGAGTAADPRLATASRPGGSPPDRSLPRTLAGAAAAAIAGARYAAR